VTYDNTVNEKFVGQLYVNVHNMLKHSGCF